MRRIKEPTDRAGRSPAHNRRNYTEKEFRPLQSHPPSIATTGSEPAGDFKYLTNNTQLDFKDIATAPLHLADSDSPLRSSRFYLALGW